MHSHLMMNSAIEWAKTRSRSDRARGRPNTDASEAVAVPDASQLHTLYLDQVYHYVARRLERHEDVEDVCAEVFAAAFEQLPRFRGEVEARLWLLGIARRRVADAPDRNRDGLPPQAAVREESRVVLHNLLAGLKDEQREALLLKYVEELSIEEIAVVMNRSKAATNSLLQRARATAFKAGEAYFLDFQTAPELDPQKRGGK
jgi:RNA polymerase sigma-70 factor (ECF subfamily)